MTFRQVLLGSITIATLSGAKSFAQNENFKFIDSSNMDLSVKPGDNFFSFANGTWVKNTQIPASQTRWGSFNELIEKNSDHLHEILENASKNVNSQNVLEKNVGNFYLSGMNTTKINNDGIKPIQPFLDRINKIASIKDFFSEVNLEQTEGIGQLFGFSVGPDDKNVSEEICNFYQGGLGLPTKEYYTATDARSEKIRNAYKQYIITMLTFLQVPSTEVNQTADAIFNFEKTLAAGSLTPVEMRDPQKLYNKFSQAELAKKYPNLNFVKLLAELKVPAQHSKNVLIAVPGFFTVLNDLEGKADVNTLKAYLKFHFISSMSPFLSEDIDKAHFDFYGKTLTGQEEQDPRWKRVMRVIDGSVGDELGQMYVAKYFKPEAKTYMLNLVNNLQQTYADRIKNLDWMSATTKAKALQKLNAFTKKIGYPDKWKNYAGLTISGDDYVANVINASKFEYDYQIAKLGKPVDRAEWGMTPPTVNAYYNPAFNEIVFPAGILQFPFFDFKADDAVNYGGIGGVIGHEMTHGFDDQGRQYDAEGNLKDWWTKEDAEKFEKRAQVVINQFDGYTVLDTVHVNGSLTIGENLADLGGVTIAYQAFKKTKQGKGNVKINGFTPDQRFFLSWAQVWRSKTRPEAAFQRIKTDPHSPAEWRVNGPLSNFEPFYKAFNVKPREKMYVTPEKRAKVW